MGDAFGTDTDQYPIWFPVSINLYQNEGSFKFYNYLNDTTLRPALMPFLY